MEALTIPFDSGFTVLTGETGAGKSILVDALLLLGGKRADGSLIMEGSDEAIVQAEWAHEHAGSSSRTFARSGRNVTRLNGTIITLNELSKTFAPHLAIFGQHAALQLAEPAYQRTLLDSTLPEKAQLVLERHRNRFRELRETENELHIIRNNARERVRQAAALNEQLKFIRQINPQLGEDEELLAEQQRLAHADLLMREVGTAVDALSYADGNAVGQLIRARAALETAVRSAPELKPFFRELTDTLRNTEATANELSSWLGAFDGDPARLEIVQDRLATLERLKRLYGDTIADVLVYTEKAERELEELSSDDTRITELEQHIVALQQELDTLQRELTVARTAAGDKLSVAVEKLLQPLGFSHAVFKVRISETAATQHGRDAIEFLFSANAARTPLPIQQVASGGELSRIMLALNLSTLSGADTMVFDEIDAGIGGATALEVAKLLRNLGKHHQVLVVSHLAQVAAQADHHYRIEKTETPSGSVVTVRPLDHDERLHELARLLSGTVTSHSLAHASELLHGTAGDDSRVG